MADREALEALFNKHGFTDFKWIDPEHIVVAQWVRFKCRFGCDEYNTTASCPPNVPSVSECKQFFSEYSAGVIFHFEKRAPAAEERHEWSKTVNQALLDMEREVFLAGHEKAFLLYMDSCCLCEQCAGSGAECRHPQSVRPCPEGLAVDVFSTVRRYGFPIQVVTDYTQPMNRYAFLLVE